jgi:hypothetical protein
MRVGTFDQLDNGLKILPAENAIPEDELDIVIQDNLLPM